MIERHQDHDDAADDVDLVVHASGRGEGLATALALAGDEATVLELSWYGSRLVSLPLIAPGLVATSVFAFIQAWNEYILAYVLLSSQDKQTVTVWLAGFTTSRGTDWGPLMAASILVAVPVVVFFLIVQGRMASGLTAGAVKG